jgi:hypothetical protein
MATPARLPPPPEGIKDEAIAYVAQLVFKYLRSAPYHEPFFKELLRLLFSLPPVFRIDQLALTTAALGHPALRKSVPALQDFKNYGEYAEIARRGDPKNLGMKRKNSVLKDPSNDTVAAIAAILSTDWDWDWE